MSLVEARSPEREEIPFSITWDAGFGSNVCVVGSHGDIGSWSPTNAVKLRWTSGNVWTGQVAVQKGTSLEYKFIVRDGDSAVHCDPANVVWEAGSNRIATTTSAPPAPYTGKTVYYYSSWTSASVLVISGTNTSGHGMAQVGPGRSGGEFLYQVDGLGEEGEGLEFVFNGYLGGTQFWDNPPYTNWNNNYYTSLDAFLVQDGHVYNYWPDSTPSMPRIETNFVFSTATGILDRPARIYLPRGYTEHTNRHYPVFYMHDGQHVFDNSRVGSSAPTSWGVDTTATREISQGRAREAIFVGIDNTVNRLSEYNVPGDSYPGQASGIGDAYLEFLLGNVKPTLDFNYRTLSNPRNTLVGGSSMGGLISTYCAYETNVFGSVLAMSPALTRAPNYNAALYGKSKPPVSRFYIDTGTDEGNVGVGVGNYWEKPWELYDIALHHGFVVNKEVIMRAGCGHVHNEAAWRDRLPDALRFLLPARDEPNIIAQERWPPKLTISVNNQNVSLPTHQHFQYTLRERSTGSLMSGSWTNRDTLLETRPWSTQSFSNLFGSADQQFYDVIVEGVP